MEDFVLISSTIKLFSNLRTEDFLTHTRLDHPKKDFYWLSLNNQKHATFLFWLRGIMLTVEILNNSNIQAISKSYLKIILRWGGLMRKISWYVHIRSWIKAQFHFWLVACWGSGSRSRPGCWRWTSRRRRPTKPSSSSIVAKEQADLTI